MRTDSQSFSSEWEAAGMGSETQELLAALFPTQGTVVLSPGCTVGSRLETLKKKCPGTNLEILINLVWGGSQVSIFL